MKTFKFNMITKFKSIILLASLMTFAIAPLLLTIGALKDMDNLIYIGASM
jgi:hypothetical protein